MARGGFVAILLGLVAARFGLRTWIEQYISPLQTGALFFLLAFARPRSSSRFTTTPGTPTLSPTTPRRRQGSHHLEVSPQALAK